MEIKKRYIPLENLDVYKLAQNLSEIGWEIYTALDWQTKKITGDQFIESTDSVGANIAEGYGRFHYLDKIKFYYNARASLMECNNHWIELLQKRDKLNQTKYKKFKETAQELSIKLNNFIASTYKSKNSKNDGNK